MKKKELKSIPIAKANMEVMHDIAVSGKGKRGVITVQNVKNGAEEVLVLNVYQTSGRNKRDISLLFRVFCQKEDYAGKSRICSPDCQKRSSRRRKQKISSVRIRDRVWREGGVMKFIARKPVVRTEVYRKYGFTYVEHKPCYCPRCNHVLNAGPNFQPKYCSECGQKIDFSGVKWEEEKILEHAGRRLANE